VDILQAHIRTCHCAQSFKQVSTSSTRKRSSFACQYDGCRNQGYVSSEDLLSHIVTSHFKGMKPTPPLDGDLENNVCHTDAYMRPAKRIQLAPLTNPFKAKSAKPDEPYPKLPDTVPSWKVTTPLIRPSRSSHLTWIGMVSRLPPRTPRPLSWYSWTDTPDEPETNLTFRDLTPARMFDPDKMLDLSVSFPPPSLMKLKSRRGEQEGASTSTIAAIEPEEPFTGIGFRRPVVKESMTVLNGDRAQGFRAPLIDPNVILPPTIGFEHSFALKEQLASIERQRAIKDARAARLAQRKRKRERRG